MAQGESGRIAVHDITKRFGDAVAVDGVSLAIEPGEFFTLLGPSGSGKTTLLRMIAGFETPTAGRIELGGVDVTAAPPFDRDVNTVFQDYALFPHMSVLRNVEYGLRVKRVPRAERRSRAVDALARVRLAGFEDRAPSQLSGGQRQRVALARALVNRPGVLLLDEPLGALDLKLREEMQLELKALQREVGVTFVFVTHDQDEALSMSDRIAVFNHGRIEQVGTPTEIYDRPTTPFVAGFVGTSNVLAGDAAHLLVGSAGTFLVRPEQIDLAVRDVGAAGPADARGRAGGEVVDVSYMGSETRFVVRLDAGPSVVVARQNRGGAGGGPAVARGAVVVVSWAGDAVVALQPDRPADVAGEPPSVEQEEKG